MSDETFARLQEKVIGAGLCTHCGTCVGLSGGALTMVETAYGPLPKPAYGRLPALDPLAYAACPGKGIPYPELYRQLSGALPQNWLLGPAQQVYIGYAGQPHIRRQGASGGVITQTLLYLLATGRIDGAIVVQMGRPQPWQAQPIIATTAAEIAACSQSVYMPVPVNTLLGEMADFRGRLAYVGLPDQVAALRLLQQAGHSGALKVDFVLGPYVGTNMYRGAIESFLRSHGVKSLQEIADLKYREGEWPGHLRIRLRDGRELKAAKFYYNYLIPFYITRSSWLAVDFTNELTDISVGDAWHPQFEAMGAGFSVVVARSTQAVSLLQEMAAAGMVVLEETTVDEALGMHGHMLDFKKRGAFIRLSWRRYLGKPVPDFGYRLRQMPLSRQLIEVIISGLFVLGSTRLARKAVELAPIGVIGPLFNVLRQRWKEASKPTKRKGLAQIEFVIDESD